MRYFDDGRFTDRAFREAQVAAGAELEEALEPFAPRHWDEALGSSGTVGAVSQVLVANGHQRRPVTPEGLRWLIERCLEAGRADKLELPGLQDDRRAVIGGGLAILYTLAAQFGIDGLLPARGRPAPGRHLRPRTPGWRSRAARRPPRATARQLGARPAAPLRGRPRAGRPGRRSPWRCSTRSRRRADASRGASSAGRRRCTRPG